MSTTRNVHRCLAVAAGVAAAAGGGIATAATSANGPETGTYRGSTSLRAAIRVVVTRKKVTFTEHCPNAFKPFTVTGKLTQHGFSLTGAPPANGEPGYVSGRFTGRLNARGQYSKVFGQINNGCATGTVRWHASHV